MNIQPVTPTHSMNPTLSQSQMNKSMTQDASQLFTPEVLNELNKAKEDEVQQKKERVQDTYDTAKNIDLTKMYYEQQQAVLNAYMQSTENGSANKSSDSSDSTVKSLTEMYASIYEHHQKQNTLPSELPVSVQPLTPEGTIENNLETPEVMLVNEPVANSQLHAYNNVMMPSTSSYMHLSA